MNGTEKPFRVIAAYSTYNVGDIIYPTGVFRDHLIRQGLCEEVKRDEGEQVECATVAPEEQAVTRTAPRPRRRRRPKLRAG